MNAPAPIPNARPYDLIRELIEDLYEESKKFADGTQITTPGQAEAVQSLMRQIQQAEKAADAERVKENEPFDSGKAEVQARYAALIGNTKAGKGKTVQAVEALKACLAPWLKKLDDDQKAAVEAARAEAARLAALASEAAKMAAGDDLGAKEQAESVFAEARAADNAAKAAEQARPQAAGFGRAATLRTTWKPELVDLQAACRHYWTDHRDAFEAVVLKLAADDVASGKRRLPGFDLVEVRTVV